MANKSIVGFNVEISAHQDQHFWGTTRDKTLWICESIEQRRRIERAFIDYFNRVAKYLNLSIDESKEIFFIQDDIDKLITDRFKIQGGKDADRECKQFTMQIDNIDFVNRRLQIHAYPCHFDGYGDIGYTMKDRSIRDFKYPINI